MWLIRISEHIDTEKFTAALDRLKFAQHSTDSVYWNVPTIVSCKSAVEYILSRSTGLNLSYLENIPLRELPNKILGSINGSKITTYNTGKIWDLVFFYWKWFRDNSVSCISHVWIMIDWDNFYHSTRTEWYTISSLSEKIIAWKVATNNQLLYI
jgi:hypothetical protein